MADGIHSGSIVDETPPEFSLSLDEPVEVMQVADLDIVVFPIVTAVTATFREGRLAMNGHGSWGVALLNTSVAVASVAGGGTLGSIIGHILLPGVGGLLGGAVGGWFAGQWGRRFGNRHVIAAAKNYNLTKDWWESKLEANRTQITAELTRIARTLYEDYRSTLPRVAFTSRAALAFRWAAWRFADVVTIPLASFKSGRSLRARAASVIMASNRRMAIAIREERLKLRVQYTLRAEALRREIEKAIDHRASLVAQMFESLNASYCRLHDALRERGRARR